MSWVELLCHWREEKRRNKTEWMKCLSVQTKMWTNLWCILNFFNFQLKSSGVVCHSRSHSVDFNVHESYCSKERDRKINGTTTTRRRKISGKGKGKSYGILTVVVNTSLVGFVKSHKMSNTTWKNEKRRIRKKKQDWEQKKE